MHTDPNKRHDFVFLFDVNNGNPNGDPDAGNLPRIDPETMHGLVTDVCIKRKIRDYVAGILKRDIFIQSEVALNTLYDRAFSEAKDENGSLVGSSIEVKIDKDLAAMLEANEGELAAYLEGLEVEGLDFDPEEKLTYFGATRTKRDFLTLLTKDLASDASEALKSACGKLAAKLGDAAKGKPKPSPKTRGIVKADLVQKFFDIRMFGAVLTAGTNAGQVRGPVQFTFAKSVGPIHSMEISITRVAITKPSDRIRKTTEMGRKAIVPYGLYRTHGFYNPFLGRQNVVTEDDLKDLWEATEKMFEFDRSASRGEMTARGLWVFTHENEKGNAPAHKLFELVRVTPCDGDPPRAFGDYQGRLQFPKDGPVEGFPGITAKRLF